MLANVRLSLWCEHLLDTSSDNNATLLLTIYLRSSRCPHTSFNDMWRNGKMAKWRRRQRSPGRLISFAFSSVHASYQHGSGGGETNRQRTKTKSNRVFVPGRGKKDQSIQTKFPGQRLVLWPSLPVLAPMALIVSPPRPMINPPNESSRVVTGGGGGQILKEATAKN